MEEACEYGLLPRGTCFVARRVELVAVAGQLLIRGVLGWADRYRFFLFLMRPVFAFRQKSLHIAGSVHGAIL